MSYISDYTFFPCEHPRLVYNKYIDRQVMVSCGYCSACVSRRLSRYTPLILCESYSHKFTYFCTLTYSDKFVPEVDLRTYLPKGDYKQLHDLIRINLDYVQFVDYKLKVLNNCDFQKFIKRLRKYVSKNFQDSHVRYFCCGDYGSTTFRPHFHFLLFFDCERLASCLASVVDKLWSFRGESIGRIDVQESYGNGQYVASYTQSATHRPVIFSFKDFAPKPLFSKNFGNELLTETMLKSFILAGQTTYICYDFEQQRSRECPLPRYLLARLFPTIPAFDSLSFFERYEVYRIFSSRIGLRRSDRLDDLFTVLNVNSFFRDYIYFGFDYDLNQIESKLDRVYYVVLNLFRNCKRFSLSLSEHDHCIQKFRFNSFNLNIKLQCSFQERLLANGLTPEKVDEILDCSNEFFYEVSPREFHPSYFKNCDKKLMRLTKSKLNHQYLSLHPEYYQFITNN